MLYHLDCNGQQILFVQTGAVATNTIHYHVHATRPEKKFIELKRLTGEFNYVDRIGGESMSLYLPILELDKTSLDFP